MRGVSKGVFILRTAVQHDLLRNPHRLELFHRDLEKFERFGGGVVRGGHVSRNIKVIMERDPCANNSWKLKYIRLGVVLCELGGSAVAFDSKRQNKAAER
jgi:hypothetical protein